MLLATSPTLMSHISFEYTNWTKRKADRLFCRCRKGRAFLSRCRDGIFRLIATLFLQRFKGRHACSVAEGLLFVYIKYSPLSINGKLFIHGETPKCSLALSMFSKKPIQIFNLHAFFCNVFHCVLQCVILNINEILHFGFGTEALSRTGRSKANRDYPKSMKTSSSGIICRVTGHLCGEFTVDFPHKGQWRGALMFFCVPEQTVE